MKNLQGYILTLFAGIMAALFVRFFIFTAYAVPTGSMQPALKPGDYIFSDRKAYQFQWPPFLHFLSHRTLSRGDIIVFNFKDQLQTQYVKRVIGLPGDLIEFEGDVIRINGQLLTLTKIEPSENNPNPQSFSVFREQGPGLDHQIILAQPSKSNLEQKAEPLRIPEGQVYVLGDNRDTSDDSRYWGTVPFENISGQVKLIWLSFENSGKIRWSRIFQSVH